MVTIAGDDGSVETDVARMYFMCDCGNRVRCFFWTDAEPDSWIEIIHYPYEDGGGAEYREEKTVVFKDEHTVWEVSYSVLSRIYEVMTGSQCGTRINIKDRMYGGVETWLTQ